MKKASIKVGAAIACAMVIPVVAMSSPASASCDSTIKFSATNITNSAKFDAHSGCDGVYGVNTDTYADTVRGRFYKDGEWKVSSLGWQPLYPVGQSSAKPKIVGNTTDGRDIKSQSSNYNQLAGFKY